MNQGSLLPETTPEWAALITCGLIFLYWAVITIQCIRAKSRLDWLHPSPSMDGPKVKISVIMPARNEARDIAASLQSILDQQHVDLEIIVVNDHSSDQTGDIAEAVARSDPRVRVFHNPPLAEGWLGC